MKFICEIHVVKSTNKQKQIIGRTKKLNLRNKHRIFSFSGDLMSINRYAAYAIHFMNNDSNKNNTVENCSDSGLRKTVYFSICYIKILASKMVKNHELEMIT